MTLKRFLNLFLLFAASTVLLSGCLFRRGGSAQLDSLNPGDQPDKILYEKATAEIDRGRFEVGRLTLQTLINTYPDSEFLAKAKLAIADSYYEQGGVSGLTQAEAEYKDFITFFPTAPEAPEAQFRAGMAHFKLMAKSDRDRTEAKLAEGEFKEFLLRYPDAHVMPRVKARLRQVQEVLAQGDFKIARFYFLKGANKAASSRFQEIADRYPSYSQADEALWYLGQSLERLKQSADAGPYYARIITEHPLSPRVEEAKQRLTELGQPIPRPTRAMLARAQADAVERPGKDMFQKLFGFMSSAPDTSATRKGPVRIGQPPPSGVEVAKTPSVTPGSSTLVVQPVGEESLKAGKPVKVTPGENSSTAASSSEGNPASGNSAGSTATSDEKKSDLAPPAKKKGKFRIFKKLVKPF